MRTNNYMANMEVILRIRCLQQFCTIQTLFSEANRFQTKKKMLQVEDLVQSDCITIIRWQWRKKPLRSMDTSVTKDATHIKRDKFYHTNWHRAYLTYTKLHT